MTQFYIGAKVRLRGRRVVGRIVRHHPTLPAWVVETKGRAIPLGYLYSELEAA